MGGHADFKSQRPSVASAHRVPRNPLHTNRLRLINGPLVGGARNGADVAVAPVTPGLHRDS